MNRYEKRFAELRKKGEKGLMPFVVLGDPDYETSLEIVKELLKHADALELGFPFSDPIADGKTIQAADTRSLANGMNSDKCFELINEIRKLDAEIPIGLLVYYNLIYSNGIDAFYAKAKEAGVDAVLAADAPVEESKPLLKAAKKSGLNQVFLVTPTITPQRMKKILSKASGFVYLVSLLGITGERSELGTETVSLIKKVRPHTKLPLCVGFGISKQEHVQAVCAAGADCAIVGSAVEKIIERNIGNCEKMLEELGAYLAEMKKAAVYKT
ncbi:MAG: tryptophan synthase subunit alpha [Candidatus Diapherotrites archaeon]